MEGTVIKISRCCTEDGPGIRTTVFLKGCPLRCIWCHNPESQNGKPELWYDSKKCIGCGACLTECKVGCHSFQEDIHKVDLFQCLACGQCVTACKTGALEIVGKEISVDEIVKEVEKDSIFYQTSGGGVTISGGEPLAQSGFASEILMRCKEKGIHTAIETSGYGSKCALEKVLKYCDYVLFDIKETDVQKHKDYTNVDLDTILASLEVIERMQIPFVIRMPIIPGLNDRKEHFETVRKLVKDMKCCQGIEVMPYHSLGVYKYEMLQRKYACKDIKEPEKVTKESWKKAIEE